ncbi:LacI family DNA-binding transcriptional regulator [Victivallis sp. Marseille-Q1083]|uniref:LacI family DNA-binding transcriptional regulator n=1 Tax=Victivallis sp. Marseille-Q1083 TaxID=2717288 RepID=UPI00158DCE83|nr:LacI family DNA-binding transcriptional regulator [Victivallis sp. Marseille-Q1083]
MDIRTFAKLLNVSESTVSRAFSGKSPVRSETKRRIFQKAAEVGYRPNGHLACNNIPFARDQVVVIHTLAGTQLGLDYMFAEMFEGINAVFQTEQWQVSPHLLFNDIPLLDDFYYDVFKAANIHGIICGCETDLYESLKERLDFWAKPFVLIGNNNPRHDNCVRVDIEAGGRMVGEYFRRIGRRHPAVVLGDYKRECLVDLEQPLSRGKERGFLAGIGLPREEVIWIPGGYSYADGFASCLKLLHTGAPFDCVFCGNDILATGFLAAAHANGIKVPEEVAVFGFDNVEVSQFTIPALSTVDLRRREVGRAAATGLLDIIKHRDNQVNMTLKPQLILRESA